MCILAPYYCWSAIFFFYSHHYFVFAALNLFFTIENQSYYQSLLLYPYYYYYFSLFFVRLYALFCPIALARTSNKLSIYLYLKVAACCSRAALALDILSYRHSSHCSWNSCIRRSVVILWASSLAKIWSADWAAVHKIASYCPATRIVEVR